MNMRKRRRAFYWQFLVTVFPSDIWIGVGYYRHGEYHQYGKLGFLP